MVQPAARIAVIGMAGRFPGARDVDAFWTNLRDGVESIHFFTEEALLAAGESRRRLEDASYVKACGRLADIDQFDASFFGMSPRDAAIFDPQHRLLLECAWEAFEDAGYVPERIAGLVGVFASSGASEYLMKNLVPNREVMESVGAWLVRHTGNDTNFLATRVSYELDLRGPSMSVQSACSSSLLAIHLACQSLLGGECDVALAAGSTVYPDQDRGYLHRQGEILSPDGHCRAFDAEAAGTVMASAVGCVVLKRLDDAVRDGDRVLAVVLGSAANNDGSDKVGYLAPSVTGQARVIAEALAMAGVAADEVSYVEAHGTGTLIGDPIEVKALTEAFRQSTDRRGFCAMGSVKTNIGHAGEAAGICGFIKTVLALEHRQIPPSLHYRKPNPRADLPESPFFVNDTLRDWSAREGAPRIAGVTALGAGGTNVHVLLQEAAAAGERDATMDESPHLLVLSARSESALDRATENVARHLRADTRASLANASYTLLAGRKEFGFRRAVVATSALDAATALEGADPARVATHHAKAEPPEIVFLFPGGGAQYARMGAELYEKYPVYRDAIEACLAHLAPEVTHSIRSLLLAPPCGDAEANARLESPSLALPALFATEYAIAELLRSWGLVPAAMMGHSAGEYAAACLAGVFSLGDAVSLVSLRGRLFETMPAGAMLSVALPEDELRRLLPERVSIAAVNAPSLCVASGPSRDVEHLEASLRRRDIDVTKVHLPIAAHSPLVDAILGEFEAFCARLSLSPPRVPFVSNLTGTWITPDEATRPGYWARHLRETVRFHDGVRTILASRDDRAGAGSGNLALVEVGPGRTLSSFARQHAARPVSIVTTLRHPQEEASDAAYLLGALGRLWTNGVVIDPEKLFAGEVRRRVRLPTYPFERKRYWIDAAPASHVDERSTELEKRPHLEEWFYAPSWGRAPPALRPKERHPVTWLVLTDGSRFARALLDELGRRADDRVVALSAGRTFEPGGPFAYRVNPSSASDFEALAHELRRLGMAPGRIVHLWSLLPRRRRARRHVRFGTASVAAYRADLARDYYALLFLARAFASDSEELRIDVVSSGVQSVSGDPALDAEKAVALGACKVLPREYPQLACTSVDVSYPRGRTEREGLVRRVLDELEAEPAAGDVALRGWDRWLKRFDPVRLPAVPEAADSMDDRAGVWLITGGLGGIGLAVAQDIARRAGHKAKIVLVGRSARPDDQRALSVSAGGAEVLVESADVTDAEAMRRVLRKVHARFGRVTAVVHAAGQLRDELVALRSPLTESAVIDTKALGAIVLDAVLEEDDPRIFVAFSSVSSILGLPGQADYSAANAFLDAFAFERAARRPRSRTLSIDWNGWQEVGMLARASQASDARALGPHPMLMQAVEDTPARTLFRSHLKRDAHWILSEHVVREGTAVLPGTGILELARAAIQPYAGEKAIELRDVVFLAPFDVGAGEERLLHVRVDRGADATFLLYGDAPEAAFARGRFALVDAGPGAKLEVEAIRARCPREGPVSERRLVQHFMDFGPRWACVDAIRLGDREALLELSLPAEFAGDLASYRLHPALLDMAVGGAQALADGFDPGAHFYVPFSYGRVLVRGPMTARMTSHVRLREGGSKESVAFDADIYDGATLEPVVRVEAFVMRRVDAAASGRASGSRPAFGRSQVRSRSAALRVGMTPAEGLDAWSRMLRAPVSPQMVACTVALDRWLDRLERESRELRSRKDAPKDTGAPVFARPSLSAAFAAPRSTLERELAGIWQDLLGVAEVGIHDDFFELGGQSLIAVRMFHRIGKKYGVELPLATLFEAPTIARCASLLRERLGPKLEEEDAARPPPALRGDSPRSPLVAIQPGDPGRTPFFCVHGAGGNVLNFRDLARALGQDQPFYGLQATGIDGMARPAETIEEMAAEYVGAIRRLQPEGPYLLGGYSGGGVVAFEMARTLTASGQKVSVLALLDTFHPQMPIRAVTVRSRLERFLEEGPAYIREGLERRRTAAHVQEQRRRIAEARVRGEAIPLELRDLHLTRSFERAVKRYLPTEWAGRAILFRAERVAYIYRDGGPCYGWDRHVLGGVDVVPVAGDHSTLLLGGNATVVARVLREAIARVPPVLAVPVTLEATVTNRGAASSSWHGSH